MQSFHRPLGTFRCFRHTPGHSVFVHAARLWLAEASGSWLGSVATHFEGTALSRAKKWGNSIGFYIVQMDNNNMAYTRTTYLWWFRGWSNYYCFPTLYRYMRVRVSIFHIYIYIWMVPPQRSTIFDLPFWNLVVWDDKRTFFETGWIYIYIYNTYTYTQAYALPKKL